VKGGGVLQEWLNISELAERTHIPETSIRRYITKFPDFFISKGGTRSRRYENSAVKILLRIKTLFDSGYESEEVSLTLRKEFPRLMEGDHQKKESVIPAMPTAEDISEIKEALNEQREFNKLLLQKLEQQERYIKESLENHDSKLIETKPAATTVDEGQKKGFWARLFGK
jgi:DNA-binding transcriptional MerR regulator